MTAGTVVVVATILGAYLLGSVPFGLLIGLARGVDVRKSGSGNIGATNVGRVLGRRYGLLAFAFDTLKGLVPMAVAPRVWAAAGSVVDEGVGKWFYMAWLAVGGAVIIGHVFPLYLRFRGGKGVATSLGVLLGVWPYYAVPGVICFGLWGVVLAISRYVSVSSMAAALAFPVVYAAIAAARGWDPFGRQWPLLAFAVVTALLLVYRHKSNLQRLLAGQENRIGARAPGGADGTAS